MKHILLLVTGIILFISCNREALYSTDPCPITITIEEGTPTASFVLASFVPSNSQTYYFAGVAPKEEIQSITNPTRFMQARLDFEYKEYVNWRYNLLVEEENYIASFANHNLMYGEDKRYFRELNSGTQYALYAFCVNPETNQPVGDLYYSYFTTTEAKSSNLSFQVMFKEREDGTYVSIMPSNDDEYYLYDWVDLDYLISKDMALTDYANMLFRSIKENGLAESAMIKGPSSYKCQEGELVEGHCYVLFAAGYDGEITTARHALKINYPFESEGPFDIPILQL